MPSAMLLPYVQQHQGHHDGTSELEDCPWPIAAYRPCVGIVLLNDQKRVFAGQRIDNPAHHWQLPQGGMEKGESPLTAMYRELTEETGITKDGVRLIRLASRWVRYDLPDTLRGTLWGGRFMGQQQLWGAFQFCGTESDINIATSHPEFRTYDWLSFNDVMRHVVPFKKEVYVEIGKIFADLI